MCNEFLNNVALSVLKIVNNIWVAKPTTFWNDWMAKSSQDRFTFSRVKTSRPTSQLKRYAYKTAAFGLSLWRYGWPIGPSRRASLGNANSILGENQIQLIVWHDGYNDFETFSILFFSSLSLAGFLHQLFLLAAVKAGRTGWANAPERATGESVHPRVCVFPASKVNAKGKRRW